MNLLLSILFSSFLFILFKAFDRYKVTTLVAVVVNYAVASLLSFVIDGNYYSFQDLVKYDWFPLANGLGLIFVSLFLIMAYSSQVIGVSTTTIANKITFIFPTAIGILWFNEDWTFLKILGFTIALLAIFLTAEKRIKLEKSNSYVIIAILFFGGGLLESALNYGNQFLIEKKDTSLFFGVLFFFAFLFGGIYLGFQLIRRKVKVTGKDIMWGSLLGTVNYCSLFTLLYALKELPSSSVFPLANMGVILGSTLLSTLLFKEQISKQKLIALFCSVIAILLIWLF